MKLLKNIIGVAFSNITNFGTSFIIGFILPAILSVSDYGYYREYSLYLSFAYLFNLGFNDGIYIKYGGQDLEELDNKKINEEHSFVLIYQSIILGIMLIFSIFTRNIIFALFSVATFFITVNTYHQNFLQAVGKFTVFSKANIYKSIAYVIMLLIAILIFNSDNYLIYIFINILSFVLIFTYYEINKMKQFGTNFTWNPRNNVDIFKIGIYILIANMSLTFVGNVGNWIVNWGFDIESFAQYSFQNSVLNVMLLIINAVGMVFYNVISKNDNPSILKIIKELSLLLGVLSGIAFFVFSFIIEHFLVDYVESIPMLSMTFIAIPYIMISKILTANIYKSRRTEKKYFIDSLLFAIGSFIIVGIVYLITKNMIGIAFATTVSYILWYLYTTRIEFKTLKGGKREILLLVSHIIWFYLTSNHFIWSVGFIGYFMYIVAILFCYKNRLLYIKNNILKI